MAIECGVISTLFLLMAIIFFRRKHTKWAIAVLPLTLVPLTEFVFAFIVEQIMKKEIDVFGNILALVIAVAAAAVWIAIAAIKLKSKKTIVTYITITNLFNIALSAILINDLVQRLS
ncbi:MAG: hypothetical protein K2N56_07990 [Oscillospiraceae bacterium]|nr:hypothetical protein [Oscillospiraceae bacterium]